MAIIHSNNSTFITDLYAINAGDTILFADGIYIVPVAGGYIPFTYGITAAAESGARPVFTGDDGFPPAVWMGDGASMTGLWFGGNRDPSVDHAFQMSPSTSVHRCTFWNAREVIVGGVADTVDSCRFINNGYGGYQHDIYFSAWDNVVNDNIFIGGEGYKIHIYNEVNPQNIYNNEALRNFANPLYITYPTLYKSWIAHYGTGKVNNNVFWNKVGLNTGLGPLFNCSAMSAGEIKHNLMGYPAYLTSPSAPVSMNGNAFLPWWGNPDTSLLGNNAALYTRDDTLTLLGLTADALDVACDAINTSFTTQTVEQILADTTIEQNFAIIDAARLAWVENTPAPEPIPEPAPAPDTTFASPRRSGRVIFLIQNNPEEEVVEVIESDTDDGEMALIKHMQMARSNWKTKEDE